MPVDAGAPHLFRPLNLLEPTFEIPEARQRRRIADWTRINGAITADRMPCLVCGASKQHPIHWDERFSSGDRMHHSPPDGA